ncbi:MAG: S41 family peptidase [Eubacterium sp.]|nr:S41 family peptidase [Eubacterium sp.]
MVRNGRRVLAVTMAGMLTIGSIATGTADASAAAKVKLSATSLTLKVGQKTTLKLKNATGKVTWKSSKKAVATVSTKGVVTGKKAGSAKITAKNNSKSYTCKVTVKKIDTVKKVVTDAYVMAPAYKFRENLYFLNGGDIPYVCVEEAAKDIVQTFLGDEQTNGLTMKAVVNGNKVRCVRDTGGYAEFDFDENTLYIPDMTIYCGRNDTDFFPTVSFMASFKGLFEQSTSSYYRFGSSVKIDFDDYHISLGMDGKKHYVPLQTFNDCIFTPLSTTVQLLYNGKDLFCVQGNAPGLGQLSEMYYSAPKRSLSKAFVDFNYNELCLGLDLRYGLKEAHSIKDFNSFFEATKLKPILLDYSANAATNIDAAIYYMINYYLDDLHSGFTNYSYNSKFNGDPNAFELVKAAFPDGATKALYKKIGIAVARAYYNAYPEGQQKVYEEVGDTAYIKFDSFQSVMGIDYSTVPTDEEMAKETPATVDTMRLMQYACKKIHENTKIKKVVLDLSMNGGGAITTALYVVGTFLGEGVSTSKDTITGAMSYAKYKIDTNCDGKFDDKDTLVSTELTERGLQKYCFISNCSFSCGNMVPCIFKDSKEVTLIGQSSGGGSCAVGALSTASGTLFQLSSPYMFSFTKNGSFYDVDRGADPDYYIKDLSKLYDRAYMNKLIDKID